MADGVGSSDGLLSRNSAQFFRKLWHLNIQNKIKIFIWKAIHAVLPSNLHLVARGISIDTSRPRCHYFPEHSFHALWNFSGAKYVWSESAMWLILARFKGRSFMDLGSVAMVSWSIWLDRNQLVHQGKALPPKDVVRASSPWEQFLACQPMVSPKTSLPSMHTSWCSRSSGIVKINVDVAVSRGIQPVGIGVVARNEQGIVLITRPLCLDGVFSAYVAELLAARGGNLKTIGTMSSSRPTLAMLQDLYLIHFSMRMMKPLYPLFVISDRGYQAYKSNIVDARLMRLLQSWQGVKKISQGS
ncbi:uncharacterized protein LOC142546901 isoform X2 [Primulina tabacum]|uniref:uncharacterized protein LOC142546901 isoform X2 n=1 Tax=Primulina tabacum TaxID=48773 RepID=UPI003F5A9A7C